MQAKPCLALPAVRQGLSPLWHMLMIELLRNPKAKYLQILTFETNSGRVPYSLSRQIPIHDKCKCFILITKVPDFFGQKKLSI